VVEVHVLTTPQVSERRLEDVRALLHEAFDDGFTDDDWEHCLGGTHVILGEAGRVVAHAAVVPRLLEAGGVPLQTGYVEGVATARGRERRGLGSRAMSALHEVIEHGFELGALSTGRHRFYERLGWERWRGATYVRHPSGVRRSAEEDDGVMVLRFGASLHLDLTSTLTCPARPGDAW
jgi:aminoglycoside 2'-N-acetyltransferase I